MEKGVTYNLEVNSSNSDGFYTDIGLFTDIVLKEADFYLSSYISEYYEYVKRTQPEVPRSKEEYLLELVITGVLWRNYIHKAEKTAYLSKIVLKKLYSVRKTTPSLKPISDKVRGILAYQLLNKHNNSIKENYSISSFTNLIEWLAATGEYNEEIIRLNQWIDFYKTRNEKEIETIFRLTISFSDKFKTIGKAILGKYIENVSPFISNSLPGYKYREDYFLAGRKENEYLLNMFGAEILNRQLRANFERTSKKAVLLPTCMRIEPKNGCQAKSDGKELVCVRCNMACNIGKVSNSLHNKQVTAYLIPHSSDFSKFLIKWKDDKEIGLIGVACVLNLLTGGYEMKRLNISSQCVFLDYCGCKKHWDKNGIATNLNGNQLKQIISVPSVSENRDVLIS